MSMVTSANHFTASLVGTLYGGLQQMHSTPRMVPVEAAQMQQQDDTSQQKVDKSGSGRAVEMQKAQTVAKSESELSDAERKMLEQLKQRDREVRSHEQAHKAAGGAHVHGGPSYSYQTGPDGKQYAVGGNVSIDVSKVPGDPEATEEKARQVRKAATAPANPSAQDMKVAAKATQLANEARIEMRRQEQEEAAEKEDSGPGTMHVRRSLDAYDKASSPYENPIPGTTFSTAI